FSVVVPGVARWVRVPCQDCGLAGQAGCRLVVRVSLAVGADGLASWLAGWLAPFGGSRFVSLSLVADGRESSLSSLRSSLASVGRLFAVLALDRGWLAGWLAAAAF